MKLRDAQFDELEAAAWAWLASRRLAVNADPFTDPNLELRGLLLALFAVVMPLALIF